MDDYLLKEKIKENAMGAARPTEDEKTYISPSLLNPHVVLDENGDSESASSQRDAGEVLEDLQEELEDYDVDEESLRETVEDLPEKPDFPLTLFIFAIIVDSAQILATFTVVLAIFTPPLGVLFGIVSFFYFFGKINFVQKYITRKLLTRFLLTFLIEFIPGLNVIPTATIFTFLAYKSQSKIIAAYLKAAESLGKAEGL